MNVALMYATLHVFFDLRVMPGNRMYFSKLLKLFCDVHQALKMGLRFRCLETEFVGNPDQYQDRRNFEAQRQKAPNCVRLQNSVASGSAGIRDTRAAKKVD